MAGTFTYTPAAGTVLRCGQRPDALGHLHAYRHHGLHHGHHHGDDRRVEGDADASPGPIPASITYGTALGSGQLDATATVPGTFTYTPAAGTVLPAGSDVLSVTFTPTDAIDYTTATTTTTIAVSKATLTPPVVASTTPAAGATGVAVGTTVTATFNEAVQSGTISFVLEDSGGNPVAAGVAYNSSTNTVVLTPNAALAPSTTYTATVSGAQDLAGTVMTGPDSWSFTTPRPLDADPDRPEFQCHGDLAPRGDQWRDVLRRH